MNPYCVPGKRKSIKSFQVRPRVRLIPDPALQGHYYQKWLGVKETRIFARFLVLWSNQRTEQQIEIKGVQSSAAETGKTGQVLPPCGHSWIWYRGKCNFFSEAKGTWAEAKDSCSALDSSLATIDTQKELNFMLRYKGDDNHWIGLRRDDKSQLWTWVNGTKFNNWFTVNDTSECAYLSYGQVKSLECDITNKWICTKVTINSV